MSGRLIIALILTVVVMIALVSSMSSGALSRIPELSRKGMLAVATAVGLLIWGGYLYVNGDADYLMWLYSAPTRPEPEKAFVSRAEDALEAWSAEADAKAREKSCLSETPELQKLAASITDWTGTIVTMYRLGSRTAVVVRIGRSTFVRTSFNEAADAALIEHGTPTFREAGTMETGDAVRFAGSAAVGAQQCVFERDSYTRETSVGVLFRFTDLKKL